MKQVCPICNGPLTLMVREGTVTTYLVGEDGDLARTNYSGIHCSAEVSCDQGCDLSIEEFEWEGEGHGMYFRWFEPDPEDGEAESGPGITVRAQTDREMLEELLGPINPPQ